MNKRILIPVVAAIAVAGCAEQADDSTLESESIGDGTVTSDVMPEQPVLTDPVPESLPDTDGAGDGTDPDRRGDGMKDETMTPEEKPMREGQTDQ